MVAYYKINNKVLDFDVNKDVDLIRFNHYIMQKENFERLKGELNKGEFYMSARTVSSDLKISLSKAQRTIKKFIDLGVIVVKKLSKTNTQASVYFYSSISETEIGTDFKTDNETNKVSKFNALKGSKATNVNTESETDFGTSKKELLKISSCSCLEEPHKNLEDERVSLVKSYGFKVTQAQEKLIEKLDKDRLLEAIEFSVAQEGKSFSYIYKVYLNNKKAPTTAIVDALGSSTKSSTKTNVKKSIADTKRKDKPIYMCSTTVEVDGKLVDTDTLSDDAFNRLVEEKQRLKWA